MSEVQQHLASVQQHSSVLEAEAIRRAEELNATKLMLQDVTATAQQAQQVCSPMLVNASKSVQLNDTQ